MYVSAVRGLCARQVLFAILLVLLRPVLAPAAPSPFLSRASRRILQGATCHPRKRKCTCIFGHPAIYYYLFSPLAPSCNRVSSARTEYIAANGVLGYILRTAYLYRIQCAYKYSVLSRCIVRAVDHATLSESHLLLSGRFLLLPAPSLCDWQNSILRAHPCMRNTMCYLLVRLRSRSLVAHPSASGPNENKNEGTRRSAGPWPSTDSSAGSLRQAGEARGEYTVRNA